MSEKKRNLIIILTFILIIEDEVPTHSSTSFTPGNLQLNGGDTRTIAGVTMRMHSDAAFFTITNSQGSIFSL